MDEERPSTGTPGTLPVSKGSTFFKLRDSCHPCAASKVKCSKEKPSCSRCVKRGTPCEYRVTKRPGRKYDTHTTHSNPPRVDAEEAFNEVPWSTATSENGSGKSTPRDVGRHSPPSGESMSSVSSDIFQGIQSPVDSSLSSLLGPMDVDFDDLFTPSLPYQDQDVSDFNILGAHYISSSNESRNDCNSQVESVIDDSFCYNSTNDAIFLLANEDSESRHHSGSTSPTPLDRSCHFTPSITSWAFGDCKSQASSTTHTRSHQNTRESSLSCGCLMRALDLLRRLLADDLLPRAEDMTEDGQLGHFHAVKAMNKRTIDSLTQILKCSCSADSYLFTIASLIVFKILNWYAVVARTSLSAPSPCSEHVEDTDALSLLSSNFTHGPYHEILPDSDMPDGTDREDTGRIAAQLVLGELHLVQCLVNQLVRKLKTCVRFESRHAVNDPTMFAINDLGSPFSTPMLDQLEPELRRQISSLASEIIGLLQQD